MISKQKTYLIMTLYLVFSADSGSPVVFLISVSYTHLTLPTKA